MNRTCEPSTTFQSCDTTITLSDSDSDSEGLCPFLMQTNQKRKEIKMYKRKLPINKKSNMSVDLSSTIFIEDSEESEDEREHSVQKRSRCAQINGNATMQNALNDTINLCDSPSPPDRTSFNSGKEKENIPNDNHIFKDEIPRPIIHQSKCLRPVAIDGSNVARAHGKVQNTFSCKGIKIAVDYFVQRGHQQVIAFLPHFHIKEQQHKKPGSVLTTDQFLLKELEKRQNVVLTPSRSYDDRFIVEYATKTGGVILSNDNFRDIASEREEFRKTINERLLMFCFVGDIIMIPHDPLGRNGPSLETFLSFPT